MRGARLIWCCGAAVALFVTASCGGAGSTEQGAATSTTAAVTTTTVVEREHAPNPHQSDKPPAWDVDDPALEPFCQAVATMLLDGQKLGALLHLDAPSIKELRDGYGLLVADAQAVDAAAPADLHATIERYWFFPPGLSAQVDAMTDMQRAREMLSGHFESNTESIYALYSALGDTCPGILE